MSFRFPVTRCPARLRRGFSLVEILVAMLILLFGIFALVRLFPAGFTTIIYGRNVSEAQMLTRAILEAARLRSDQLPDAVLAMNPLTATAYPALPVDAELTDYQPNPAQPPDTRFSDLNKIRRVLGESTRIPAPTTASLYMPPQGRGGQRLPVSVYTLTFSPIYSAVPTLMGLGGIYIYAGNSLNRVVFDGPPSAEQMALLDAGSYGIDYGNGVLYCRPAPTARQFKLEYSFTVPTGGNTFLRAQSRPDNCVYLPANDTSYDLRQAHPNQPPGCVFYPLPTGARLDPNQDFVYRGFDRLPAAAPFSNTDPYQFKVLNSVLGIIGFNPLGAQPGAGGSSASGIAARIDYDVDDWHIIHEDRVVPISPPHTLKLTLNGIEPVGAVDVYQEAYTGLMKSYAGRPASTQDIDLLIVDTETGLTIDSRTLHGPNSPSEVSPQTKADSSNGVIDYRDGSISFPDAVRWTLPNGQPGTPDLVAGKRVRIYYRTAANWGLQLTKAANSYVYEADIRNVGYREYSEDPNGFLYFPIRDHDQTVLVDYTWTHRELGQEIVRTETGEYHQISDPTATDSPQTLFNSPSPCWWVRLDGSMRQGYVPGSLHVLRVRGVSVRARAIWREGTRWRRLDLDSYVGRDRGT